MFKIYVGKIIISLIATTLIFVGLLGLLAFLRFSRSNMLFTPNSYYSKVDIPENGLILTNLDNRSAKIKKAINPGSANGYRYTVTYTNADTKEILACGDLYWTTSEYSELVYVIPNYAKGTTSCSSWLSGNFVEEKYLLINKI